MYFFLISSLVFLMPQSFARPCEVYGISDSPQKLDCTFRGTSLALRCYNGVYKLNSTPIKIAYHEDVESGPVPLIFKADDMKLTVLMHEKADIEAVWERKGHFDRKGLDH
jgi:hypothetical protein